VSLRDVSGQVVAITGAARGIGRASAEACARAGMRVAIGDVDGDAARQTAAEIGAGAIGLGVDVRDRDGFAAFLDEVERQLGPLDVMVNNAGVLHVGAFAAEDPRATERTVAVNLRGVLTGTQLALERYTTRGSGHAVNIASTAGHVPAAGGATYTATKHAVVGFTRALRGELRGTGIRTTIVAPGIVRTQMITGFAPARGGRVIEAADVGAAIVHALQTRREEIFVPAEMTVFARLVHLLPPRASDWLGRVLGADRVMLDADRAARADTEGS
jgi:short-subunit dehydrogenase